MLFNCKYKEESYVDPIIITIDMCGITDYKLDTSDPTTVEMKLLWSMVSCFWL